MWRIRITQSKRTGLTPTMRVRAGPDRSGGRQERRQQIAGAPQGQPAGAEPEVNATSPGRSPSAAHFVTAIDPFGKLLRTCDVTGFQRMAEPGRVRV
jgi:hypothetical protein